jgi:hypothetical protein
MGIIYIMNVWEAEKVWKKEPQMGLAHIQVAISENNKAFHVCGNAFIVPIL